MSKLFKTTALFFAALLVFMSRSTENYGLLLTSHLQNTQSENSGSYFSTEKPDLLFLYRNDEKQVNSVRNLPVPGFKNHPNDICNNSFFPEIRILSINSGYISYSMIADRSLTNSDIVFPFHYFW